MRLEELTQTLKLDAFYKAYVEQETQPAYSDIPFCYILQVWIPLHFMVECSLIIITSTSNILVC